MSRLYNVIVPLDVSIAVIVVVALLLRWLGELLLPAGVRLRSVNVGED
jgi:hypothetical protein